MSTPTDSDFPFEWQRAPTHEAASQLAAAAIATRLQRRPGALLCLATGATPERCYQLLAEHGRREPALFRQARILKLDEWGGLALDDPATCEAYLRRVLVEPLNLRPDQFVGWESRPADVSAECRRIRDWLREHGPIDLCILGLGLNGHLGFNEPASTLQLQPHRAELAAASQGHSMLSVARGRPEYGLTLGFLDLFRAREIFLLVTGAHKRRQIERWLRPELSTDFPASLLWLHPGLTVFVDEAAWPQPGSQTRSV